MTYENVAEASAQPFGESGAFAFGISIEGTATALRDLADKIESGTALVQDVFHISHAAADDFTMQQVIIKFAERRT